MPPRGALPHMPLDLSCPARAPPFRSPNSERPTERDRESNGASAGRPIGRPRRRGADDPPEAAAPTRRAPVGRRWRLLALSRPPAGLAPRHKAPRDSAHMTSEHVHGDDDGGEADAGCRMRSPRFLSLSTYSSLSLSLSIRPAFERATPRTFPSGIRLLGLRRNPTLPLRLSHPPPNTRAPDSHRAVRPLPLASCKQQQPVEADGRVRELRGS